MTMIQDLKIASLGNIHKCLHTICISIYFKTQKDDIYIQNVKKVDIFGIYKISCMRKSLPTLKL